MSAYGKNMATGRYVNIKISMILVSTAYPNLLEKKGYVVVVVVVMAMLHHKESSSAKVQLHLNTFRFTRPYDLYWNLECEDLELQ